MCQPNCVCDRTGNCRRPPSPTLRPRNGEPSCPGQTIQVTPRGRMGRLISRRLFGKIGARSSRPVDRHASSRFQPRICEALYSVFRLRICKLRVIARLDRIFCDSALPDDVSITSPQQRTAFVFKRQGTRGRRLVLGSAGKRLLNQLVQNAVKTTSSGSC